MSHLLQHLQLVVDHLVIAFDVLLQDDLDCDFALGSVGLLDNAIGTCAESLAHAVFAPGTYCERGFDMRRMGGWLTCDRSFQADRAAC